MKRILEIVSYCLIVLAALFAAKLPEPGMDFPVSFGLFIILVSVATIVLLLVRYAFREDRSDKVIQSSESLDLAFETTAFLSRLIVFKAQIQDIDKHGLCELVDQIYGCFIDDLLERKSEILVKLGTKRGVDFYSSLAAVEMYLNRSYSMASDDYLEQAKESLDFAVDSLQNLLDAVRI